MKTITLVTSLLTILSSSALAASVPWVGNFAVDGGLAVPPGKILIIEQMSSLSTFNARFSITGNAAGGVGSGAFSFTIVIPIGGVVTKLQSPIRLGPGMTITNTVGNTMVAFFGTVVDSSDFFAFGSPVIKSTTAEGGQLAAVVDSRTPNLTKTTGETSYDLQTWSSEGVTVVPSSSNPRLSKVTTPTDTARKFVRAKVSKRSLAAN